MSLQGRPTTRSRISSTTAKRTVQLLCTAHPLYPARLAEISVGERREDLGLQMTKWFIVISVLFQELCSCTTMLLKTLLNA